MPDNGAVIITGKLDDTELTKSIDKLVKTIDNKLGIAAQHFEQNIGRMQLSLDSFAKNANTKVGEIKTAFQQLGTTYDQFARAMERAAAAASGMGSSGGSSGGGTKLPAAPGTIGALREEINAQKQLIDGLKQETAELQHQVDILRKKEASYKRQLTSSLDLAKSNVKFIASDALSKGDRTLAQAQNKLYRLQDAMNKLELEARRLRVTWQDLLPQSTINRLQNAIDKTTEKVKKLQQQANMPTTMAGLKGMSEKTLEDISLKMNAIRNMQMKMPVGSRDITALNMEYARLSKMQSEILGKNASLISSNSALGRSFNYIKNRLAFALTVGAFTGFLRSLLEVRGQYELLERSIGVLMDDMERGSQIFNELNEMALKSPFTLIELGTAAKQLSAYNFAADEVVDTTKRLADISSALGVPMERLVYNLGQIKAQGVLNARDARDFANAGLAIVPMLAEMYTEQKRFGEQAVTTAQVYDMMKKKMVTYNDVLRVIQKTTDEGGKFFDFQAKQAGTLKVQLANLNLAWNNMLNDIGKENQGMLSGGVGVIRDMLKNWKQVIQAIKAAGVALGVYKAISMLVGATHAATWGARALINIKNYIAAIKSASGAMATFNAIMSSNVVLALASALAGLITYFTIFNDKVEEASQEVKTFGENGANAINKVKTLEKILKGSEQTSSTYKKALGELNGILDEYGVKQIKESDGIDVVNQKRRELIELIKEESAERERANQLMSGEQRYEEAVEAARKTMEERLRKAQSEPVISGLPFTKNLKEVQENAAAISEIIASVVQNRVQLIAGKTGEEWEKGFNEILKEIQDRMRHIGISESTIKSQWLTDGILRQSNIVSDYINVVSDAKHAQDLHNESVEKNYKYSKDASEATMTFTQKVEANARALRNNSKDAVSLYNRIMDIVKVAEQNHIINFDLRLTAQNPPQWMFDKSLPELEKLARNFAAIAKSAEGMGKINVNGTMFTREEAYERALQYASAAKEKQYKEEQKAQDELNKKKDKNTRANNSNKKSSDELAKALQNEISLIKKLQSEYDKLTKAGVTQQEALEIVQDAYGNTLSHINATMRKYKLPELDLSIIKGRDPNSVLKFFTTLRDILSSKGLSNIERMKAVEGVIEEFTVSAKTYNLDKITKGLNNELGKIKEEYELAVELDANPELGDMFADMFGIDVDELPHTFGEAYDRANKVAIEKLKELQADVKGFDLMSINIENFAKNQGLEMDSQPIQDLMKLQQTWRDMFKKNITETEKYLDDYVKKYGNMSDKIAEIEADRLNKIKQLNEAYYTEQMRRMPEYTAKLDAINKGAEREKGGVRFDEFKNSRLYVTMFENLQYVSTATLETIRSKLEQLKSEMGTLTPEQLKQVVQQFEKIDNELRNRSPFKGLLKNYHDYIKANGKAGKQAEKDLVVAQENYDKQMQVVTALKEQLVQAEAKEQKDWMEIARLRVLIQLENDKLKGLDEELQKAIELNEQYNLMKKAFGDQWQQIGKLAQTVATNFKSLGELRDYLKDAGVDFGDVFDGVVDSLQGVSEGMNQIVSSATSGDVFGVVTGTIKTVFGIGDAIASIFGDGAARTRRINREIKKSQEEVRRLNMAYKDLERTVNKAMGSQEIAAQRALIANKKAEKAEIERQLRLEKSKRSKDRDEDAIKQYEETLQSLKHEIEDLGDSVVENLLGNNVKSAAEDFVDTWVSAWKQGENTLDAIEGKMDEITQNLIKKAVASKLVGTLLQPFYDAVDNFASETSEGGVAITMNELQILSAMLQTLGVNINDVLTGLYNNLESIGIISKGTGATELSALQQGISSITETTAEALEAYMNGVSQQVYYQSDILTQIRDILINFGGDVTIATNAQILFELQQSYQVQMSIQSILQGWSNASGLAVRVEMV